MPQNANGNWPGLAEDVLVILRSLACRRTLDQRTDGLVCAGCAKRYPALNGVVRSVDAQNTPAGLDFNGSSTRERNWMMPPAIDRRMDFAGARGFRPDDLAGKLVLDVGCGMGRFTEVVKRWGAHVVGIDLSLASEVVAKNLEDRTATIFQADVFQLPFAPGSFDFIYSIGVLHHTPNCEQAVKVLPKLLKPGGRIAVWLYSSYNPWYRMSDVYRKVTRCMPPKMLHKLCYAVIPLYGVHQVLRKIPLVGKPASGALAWMIPMSFNKDATWRVLDTFDWYSPWYQSKHTYEEVFRWFESCGLEDLRVIEQPIAVQGRRPLVGELLPALQASEVQRCAE